MLWTVHNGNLNSNTISLGHFCFSRNSTIPSRTLMGRARPCCEKGFIALGSYINRELRCDECDA
jgi:hypothetical protein